jgi:hypothetical protein
MLTKRLLFYLWCLVAGGILLTSMLPGSGWTYQAIAVVGANRWVHFLVFVSLVAFPVASWARRNDVLIFLTTVVFVIVLEFSWMLIPGLSGRPQNVLANLFGLAAGILLGLNIRMMLKTEKEIDNTRVQAEFEQTRPHPKEKIA